ncbi:hypothetical protein L873DRAFT_769045 [Choiromyces venosus 120613-1]|uniref:Uncharacterized protein n=1 Tax=Choiromyces venosus 120613-1 TaxID=1336337 RepID=A0A3N4IVS9_9PEZI|nr:hypothetical protein L873DRAFT_769045 [Choiromyces venosus 120613-1]
MQGTGMTTTMVAGSLCHWRMEDLSTQLRKGYCLGLTCIFILTATMCRSTQMTIIRSSASGPMAITSLAPILTNNLDKQFLQHPRRPVDQLLRWHFS